MKRFVRAVLPAFLLAVSVGQIYAFTNFSDEIAQTIGESQKDVQFAFSLGIFLPNLVVEFIFQHVNIIRCFAFQLLQ